MSNGVTRGLSPAHSNGTSLVNGFIEGRDGHAIPIRDYIPKVDPLGAFMWVHGGGFMNGGLDQKESDEVARVIAAAGWVVRTIDYRLVPMVKFRGRLRLKPSENRFPAPLHDVLDVYNDFARSSASVPFLGGASAGACIALSAALSLRDQSLPLPSGLLLAYGTFHGHPVRPSNELASRFRRSDKLLQLVIGSDALERMNVNYGGSRASLDDKTVFPGGGNLTGLPATNVLNADRDGLRASGDALAEELSVHNVPTDRTVLRESVHGFFDKPGSPAFIEGTANFIDWLDSHRPMPLP